MIKRFQIFLGPQRFKAFVSLFAITGFLSLVLNVIVDQYEWVAGVQSLLVLGFLIGAGYLILSRLPIEERKRWLSIIIPAILMIVMGSLVFPQITGLFVGAGVGWIVAGIFIFNSFGAPQEYKIAVKAMRKQEYDKATDSMSRLIEQDPKNLNYYRFRAELFRLWGKLKQARKDYQKMIELDAQSAVAYNGLAEVELQANNYQQALAAAQTAYELAPDEWVAVYNLGMIEDRLKESEIALQHLNRALELKIPDSRHRLLVHLYRARAYLRLDTMDSAQAAVNDMKREKAGLEEWQVIMSADEAKALRDVLEDDIKLADKILNSNEDIAILVGKVSA